ncbi:acyl-CoA carboxylase subunit epsilon [Rhodococcus sp. 14C212]|uniref:acyl-CoA carboxylase epsilon subunit n=1 Tax=Rhodococcus sp. 14C212 TaxID=2711209 RepID=UPI0013EBF29E|nr:acyl-CoA carboxylase subunit epsilon [Rhodococcus sp. 14C212]
MTAVAEEKTIIDTEVTEVAAAEEAPAAAPVAETAAPEAPAAIRIVKGRPSDVEVAALVAVLAAAAGSAAPAADDRPRETWGDPTRMHRRTAPFSPYSYPNLG